MSGKILTDQERQNIVDFVDQKVELAHKEWEAAAKPYIKQAEKRGIPLETVAPEIIEYKAQKKSKTKEAAPKEPGYSTNQEAAISHVMSKNNISRESAIKALKDAGKL